MNRVVLGQELLKEMEQEVANIRQNLKATQDRQKIYVHHHTVNREFSFGDHVYLKVREKKSSLKLGIFAKLSQDIVGHLKYLKG